MSNKYAHTKFSLCVPTFLCACLTCQFFRAVRELVVEVVFGAGMALALLACLTIAVDRSKFKTCDQAGFCHRLRSKQVRA